MDVVEQPVSSAETIAPVAANLVEGFFELYTAALE